MNSQHECSICQDVITGEQNRIILGQCNHIYHAICIQTWATFQTTCPLCRQNFGDRDALQLRRVLPALMALAVWQPIEEQMQRLAFAFAYIRLVLTYFPNSHEFNTYKDRIIRFSEAFSINNYRAPLLCYTTRNDFQRQLNLLKSRFRTLTGQNLERHAYVRAWKFQILQDVRASMFFFQKLVLEQPAPGYYQVPQQPHTS
jgi:hypothetical protein